MNINKKTDLSLAFLKKEHLLQRERLKIRNFLVSSIIFTAFAMVCSLLVTNSVSSQRLANRLQNKLNLGHIIALHAIGLSTLIKGESESNL